METIYALIKDGVVVNTIVADADNIAVISSLWDYCIDITNLTPRPSVNWLYDGETFTQQ
jgi:hypothetical protein